MEKEDSTAVAVEGMKEEVVPRTISRLSVISSSLNLLDLPDQVLEAVLLRLPLGAVSRAGACCRRLRRLCALVLRRELRSLVPRIEGMMAAVEALVRVQLSAESFLVPVVMRLMLHTLLRLLLGEARVLRAIFWRYVREDLPPDAGGAEPACKSASWASVASGASGASGAGCAPDAGAAPLLCFPGGALLDEMERLLTQVAAGGYSSDMEPEAASSLFMRVESFLDHFETAIEPSLPAADTPFGVRVVDLLGACESAECALSVTHGAHDQPFAACMHFELGDVSAVESPPPFDRALPPRAQLRMLFRYLRNNVRWSNFFRPMRELWDLQDEIESRVRPGGERRDISRHHQLHQEVMEAVRDKIARGLMMAPVQPRPPLPRSSSVFLPRPRRRQRTTYEQVWLSTEPPMWRETFSRRASPLARAQRQGLSCELELSGAHKALLPLDLEFLDERRVRATLRHSLLLSLSSSSSHGSGASERSSASGAEHDRDVLAPLAPPPPPLPPPPQPGQAGEAAVDWGPWFRIRVSQPPRGSFHEMLQGPWEDCGASLRAGGAYGFRGEVRVSFPPRAMSSIVTETVIVVRDSDADATLFSERRFV